MKITAITKLEGEMRFRVVTPKEIRLQWGAFPMLKEVTIRAESSKLTEAINMVGLPEQPSGYPGSEAVYVALPETTVEFTTHGKVATLAAMSVPARGEYLQGEMPLEAVVEPDTSEVDTEDLN